MSRAEIGLRGAQLGIDGVDLRGSFRLLTEPALTAGGAGVVQFAALFPRSLETVQFLRVVAVGTNNREAAFVVALPSGPGGRAE